MKQKHEQKSAALSPLLPLGALMLAGVSLGAQANPTVELPAVTVQAAGEVVQDGYRATTTRVGKTLQDPHDIPQAVTTVTGVLMEEQQVGSLKEALRNVSGLSFNAAEGGRAGDNMNLRGFYTFGDIYLDGIRDTAQYNRETFNLEQVDVLRGSAAMLFGRGQAGGVINQVSKTPLLGDRGKLGLSLGTDDYQELTGDFNKQLGNSTALRINVMKRDEGSWRENPVSGAEPEVHREGLGASFVTGLYTDDEFTFSHYHLKTADNPDYGIPFDRDTRHPTKLFKNSTFWGSDDTFDDSQTEITTLGHQHRFSRDTQLRTALRHAHYERAYWAQAPSNSTGPTADASSGSAKTRKSDTTSLTLQSDLTTRARLLGMKHELLAGLEYLKEDASRWSLQNTVVSGAPFFSADAVNLPATEYEGETIAVYVQDTIEFIPDWKLTLGLRRDELDATYSSTNSPELSFGENSVRTGLSWQPDTQQHYYLSYSDAFSPTADLYQLSGGELPPERSQVTELGAKWLLLDGDLALRSALYRADKQWERSTDLESTGALISRKRHTDGIELELAGRLSDKWEVFAGLAVMDARGDEQYGGVSSGQTFAELTANGTANGGTGYDTGEAADADRVVHRNRYSSASEGEEPRNTPALSFNLWSTYRFMPGWKVGLGAEYKSDRLGYGVGTCDTATQNATTKKWSYNNCSTNFNPNKAPSYLRWDAMLAYEQPSWSARLNVKNLLDKAYHDSIYDNGGFTVPGTRRAVILSAEYKF